MSTAAGPVFVLGAGRAGRALAAALRESDVRVVGVHGRRGDTQAGITAGVIPASIAEAAMVLVAVRDDELDRALAELARAPLAPGAVVLHLSGSADPAALGALRALGHPAGTFHPLVAFTQRTDGARWLRDGGWIGLDGDAAACDAGRALAAALGARTLDIPAGEKARYHAAAVIASNFAAVLTATAADLLAGAGVPREQAEAALRVLAASAAENARTHEGLAAVSGPVVRGDVGTVRRHLDALAGDAELDALYRALTRAALRVVRSNPEGRDDPRWREIERVLGPPPSPPARDRAS